jgi:hypothetical protein
VAAYGIARSFYRNAINNGLLAVTVHNLTRGDIVHAAPMPAIMLRILELAHAQLDGPHVALPIAGPGDGRSRGLQERIEHGGDRLELPLENRVVVRTAAQVPGSDLRDRFVLRAREAGNGSRDFAHVPVILQISKCLFHCGRKPAGESG